MPSFAEIASSLQGAIMLARRDTAGFACFTMTADGFWRSFLAVLLVAPLYLAVSSLGSDPGTTELSEGSRESPSVLVRLVVLTVEWLAYPAAMAFVTRLLGLQHNYVPYVIVYNWSSVLAMAAVTPPFLLNAAGIIDTRATVALFVVLSLLVIYYRWYIARTALATNGPTAAGIVAFDFVFSMFVGIGVERLLNPG